MFQHQTSQPLFKCKIKLWQCFVNIKVSQFGSTNVMSLFLVSNECRMLNREMLKKHIGINVSHGARRGQLFSICKITILTLHISIKKVTVNKILKLCVKIYDGTKALG